MLVRAVRIAESRGFERIHGIVDSMWLRKRGATNEEYLELCGEIMREMDLPISFEGRYKWIVFLNSRVDPSLPVLNRYYGVFQDGTIKVRGIDLRRHDTPEIVRKCQAEMLTVLSQANNSSEFKSRIPKALDAMRSYVRLLRTGRVPLQELVIRKNLSKNPREYRNLVPQAVAALNLAREGGTVHAGQRISYILTNDKARTPESRAVPLELVNEDTAYDMEKYVELLVSSAKNLLLPFGYDTKLLRTATCVQTLA